MNHKLAVVMLVGVRLRSMASLRPPVYVLNVTLRPRCDR